MIEVTGSLQIPGTTDFLGLDLELRRNRLMATLFARSSDDRPTEMQIFLFYRIGTKGPARRAPEAPARFPVPNVAAQTGTTPPARPQTNPTAQLTAEWTQKLRGTQLSHTENDFQSDYGSSTYFERRIVLDLFEFGFVLVRSTSTRVSFQGMTSSTPRHSRTHGHMDRSSRWCLAYPPAAHIHGGRATDLPPWYGGKRLTPCGWHALAVEQMMGPSGAASCTRM